MLPDSLDERSTTSSGDALQGQTEWLNLRLSFAEILLQVQANPRECQNSNYGDETDEVMDHEHLLR